GSAGSYVLHITNPNGSAATTPVTVTVANDTTHPKLVSALAAPDGKTITLTFSKAMKASTAQSTANYSLTPSVSISSAVLSTDGTVVTLTTASRPVGTYSLRIANLTDNRFLANALDPNPTVVSLSSMALVLGYGSGTWKYETNSQDATLSSGTPWYAPAFDDSPWQSGQAFFGFEATAAVTNALPPPRIVTVLPPNSDVNFSNAAVTSYFRRPVTLPPLPAGGVYALCHYIDDGAIFYLDGIEFGRYNMPLPEGGPALFVDRASAAIEASLQCLLFTATSGNHSLAIEVHQGGVTTSDVLFGAEIVALPAPPRLKASLDGSGVHITWPQDAAWGLFGARPVAGPYAPVAGNPLGSFVIPPAAATNMEFFHLRYRDPQ